MTPAVSTGIVGCLSGALALLTCWWLAKTLRRRRMVAHPNERSSHTLPTPVGGGVGMLVGLLVGVAGGSGLGLALPSLRLLAAVVVLGAVGLWDDWSRRGVPWALRLCAHVGLAGWVAIPVGEAHSLPPFVPTSIAGGPLSTVLLLAVAWMVGLLNVVNFMDEKYIESVEVCGERIRHALGFEPKLGLEEGWRETLSAREEPL